MIEQSRRALLPYLAMLLEYPVADMEEQAAQKIMLLELAEPLRAVMHRYIAAMREKPIEERAVDYVATFDFGEKTSLHLTATVYGDDARRGEALMRLAGLCREAGYMTIPGQLPDYLPALMELFAVANGDLCRQITKEIDLGALNLYKALVETGSVYADLVGTCLHLMQVPVELPHSIVWEGAS